MKPTKTRSILNFLLITLLSLILAVLFFYPTLESINTQFIGDGFDNYEYASYMMLFRKNVLEGRLPFESINLFRYPIGFDFARSFDSHLAVTLGGIIHLFTKFPLGYNLTIFILVALNGIFSFYFFRYLTNSKLLGVLGMIIYGFSYYTLAKSGAHLNLLFVGGFPLLGLALLKFYRIEKPGYKTITLFFASLVLIAIGSKQYFVLSLISLILVSILTFLFYRNIAFEILRKIKLSLKKIFLVSFFFTLSMVGIFYPYLKFVFDIGIDLSDRGRALFESTPGIADFFLPNSYLNLLPNILSSPSPKSIEFSVFLGWIEITLFILFLFHKAISKNLRMFIFFLFGVPFVLALGYGEQNSFALLPYRFLKDLFVFKAIAEPGRFFIIFYLFMTSGIVLFLKSLKTKPKLYLLAATLTIIVVLLERLPNSIMTVPTLEAEYTSIVRAEQSSAVVDIPVNQYHPDYNVLAFYYNKPIVNGYFHWLADNAEQRSFLTSSNLIRDFSCTNEEPLRDFSIDNFLNTLKEQGIRIIVIHKDNNLLSSDCRNVNTNVNKLKSNVLVPDETNDERELITTIQNSYPELVIYFPKKGEFYLNGLYIAPDPKADFDILLDGASLGQNYTWNPIGSPNAMEIQPRNKIILNVNRGSRLSIKSDQLINSTYFSLFYRYNPSEPISSPLIKRVETIYTSPSTDILRIN